MNDVKDIWRKCNAVCFDVDSTVCTTEMIDDLATFFGVGESVKSLTKKAMGEGMPFREALDARLKMIKPTRDKLNDFKSSHVPVLTEGVSELVTKLIGMNKDIYLVSGGFRSLIEPIAARLGIKERNIFANRILFDTDGNYAGFDTSEPTSDSNGKKVVVGKLKSSHGFEVVTMIGDGMTDLEAYPPADLFIGFGGNVEREKVREAAPWYVMDFKELIDAL